MGVAIVVGRPRPLSGKADIQLILLKRAANDPKPTFDLSSGIMRTSFIQTLLGSKTEKYDNQEKIIQEPIF